MSHQRNACARCAALEAQLLRAEREHDTLRRAVQAAGWQRCDYCQEHNQPGQLTSDPVLGRVACAGCLAELKRDRARQGVLACA